MIGRLRRAMRVVYVFDTRETREYIIRLPLCLARLYVRVSSRPALDYWHIVDGADNPSV